MDTEVLEDQEQEEEMIDISLGDADDGSGPADPEEPEEEEEGAGDGNEGPEKMQSAPGHIRQPWTQPMPEHVPDRRILITAIARS